MFAGGREVHRFCAVTEVVDTLFDACVSGFVIGLAVFGGEGDLIAVLSFHHPLPDKLLGFSGLTIGFRYHPLQELVLLRVRTSGSRRR
jgi:hypothetical protein